MTNLFANLFVAHLLGDFFFQTDAFCQKKQEKGLRGFEIYVHAVILFAVSWLVVWDAAFWWAALLIGTGHLVIDVLKSTVERKIRVSDKNGAQSSLGDSRFAIWTFLADQLLHIGIIYAVISLWLCNNDWNQFAFIEVLGMKPFLFFIALMICSKPANILIRYILRYYSNERFLKVDGTESFKSGALIGNLERWLVVFFIYIQQFEAIGFLIAAKSILRFNETKKPEKSEYVLAGTLLSLIIALACGWIVFML
jgi:hypothetical protein